MTSYQPRHARHVNHTGPIIVTTTAALVAAVPTVALAQTTTPSTPKPTTITQTHPAIDTTRDIPAIKQRVVKTRQHLAVVEAKKYRHVAAVKAKQHRDLVHRRSQIDSKPVVRPTYTPHGNLTQSQLAALWVRAGGNPAYAHLASAVAMAESSGRQYVRSGSNDFGYWQINGSWGSLATYDSLGNARAAITISHDGHNWSPWTTYTSGAYLRYM